MKKNIFFFMLRNMDKIWSSTSVKTLLAELIKISIPIIILRNFEENIVSFSI